MGSLVGHLYPRLVRLALRVKEQEKKRQCRIRELSRTGVNRAVCRGSLKCHRSRGDSSHIARWLLEKESSKISEKCQFKCPLFES